MFVRTNSPVRLVSEGQLLKVLHILRVSPLSLEVAIGEVKVVEEGKENHKDEKLEVNRLAGTYKRPIVHHLFHEGLVTDLFFSAQEFAFHLQIDHIHHPHRNKKQDGDEHQIHSSLFRYVRATHVHHVFVYRQLPNQHIESTGVDVQHIRCMRVQIVLHFAILAHYHLVQAFIRMIQRCLV